MNIDQQIETLSARVDALSAAMQAANLNHGYTPPDRGEEIEALRQQVATLRKELSARPATFITKAQLDEALASQMRSIERGLPVTLEPLMEEVVAVEKRSADAIHSTTLSIKRDVARAVASSEQSIEHAARVLRAAANAYAS